MFASRVMAIKMSKKHFYVFSANDSKTLVKLWAQHVSANE